MLDQRLLLEKMRDLLNEALSDGREAASSGSLESASGPGAAEAAEIYNPAPEHVASFETVVEVSREAPQPLIHDTAAWGARRPNGRIVRVARPPTGIVIHHTTDPNTSDRSREHAFRKARAIQKFHMDHNGWIDSGQHFTISRGGHIMEGRHGSLAAAISGREHVIGAHAGGGGCNRRTVGIENEGLYTSELPTPEQWRALVQLCAWLCDQYGIDPDEIIGHRECNSTQCPGNALFADLPRLRRDVGAAV